MPNLKAMFAHPKYRFEVSLFYECGDPPEGHRWSPGDSYAARLGHDKCPGYLRDSYDPTLIKLCVCEYHKDVQALLEWVKASDAAGERWRW